MRKQLDRRRFMTSLGSSAVAVAGGAAALGATPMRGASARPPSGPTDAAAAGSAQVGGSRVGVPRIDGLGEVRIDYGPDVLEPMIASGMTAVHITLGNPALDGDDAFADALAEIGAMRAHIRATQQLRLIQRADQIVGEAGQGRLGLIFGMQNASPLGTDPDRLGLFHELGVRVVQLTYNRRNLLGDGCLERSNARLSHLGVAVVERMNELGMLVDLSHCAPATEADAIEVTTRPPAVTHSGCMALFEHPRNKTDAQLRALARAGGVFGVYQLNPNLGSRERNTLDDYLDHIDHAVRICGVEHVGIGSDREHRTIPDTEEQVARLREELARLGPRTSSGFRWPFFLTELNHPGRMETIAEGLDRRRYRSGDIERILGGNWMRLYREVIG